MGYTQAIFAVMLLAIAITRNRLHVQLFTLLYHQAPFPTHPRLLTFIRRHPSLHALLRRNPRLLSLIHISPPRPPSLDSSPFGRLAPEITQHIASFLSPSASASFASTCLAIRLITGTQYLAPLNACPIEKTTLLELLALDLNADSTTTPPSHLLCLYCHRLVPYPALCGPTATPYCKENSTNCQPYVPSSFRPQLLHTAMMMHRRGHNPYPIISNMPPRSTTTLRLDNGVTRQELWKYCIIQGSLYQRVRWTFILPRCETNYTLQAQPCPHYATYQACMDREALHMQDLARGRSGMRAYSEMVSCQHCRTVLRVGCRKFRGLGLGLFVTWWADLGDGQWVAGEIKGSEWKDVKYSSKWLTNYFDSLCYSQRYFDFEGIDTRADRKELFVIARGM
ncbi:hypothetical protein VF21_06516 [Pseudogymnoascus sp. 05NY08]|nr:hypothetical protein VF21_06516 [Pseudogymnoascus sp. 05NY08]